MATTPPIPIDAGPALPSSSDSETTFDAAFEAFLSWQKTQLQPQTNAIASNVYSNAQAAEAAASTAVGARDDAADSASAANADALRLASLDALWLGAAAADPATGRGGAALVAGNAYVNSGTGLLRTYNGTAWVNALNVTSGVTSVNGTAGAVTLKTVAGQSLVGSGDVPFKTINGNSIQGSGNIVLSSGAMVYLGTVTAVNAASADITGLDTYGVTYDRLVLICDRVNPNAAPGTEIRATFQTGGVWQTTGYDFATTTETAAAAPVSARAASSARITLCTQAGAGSSSPSIYCASIIINIPDPAGAGGKVIEWVSTGYDGTASPNVVRGMGGRSTLPQATLQALRIQSAVGNIWGVFRLYGIAKS